MGSWERSGLASGCPCVILWSADLLCSGVGSTFYCPRFWRGLCVWPSSQRRSGSWPFFFWPCCLSPSPGVGSASAAWQVLPFTWAFSMSWFFTHGGLASGFSGSLPSRFERLVSLQGASDSMTHFSPKGVVVFSGSGLAVRALLLATSLTLTMVLSLTPGRFVRLCLFRMVLCPLGACSEVPGSPVLLGSYASRVLPWVAGFLSSCHPSGGASLVLQNLVGLGGAPPDIRRACFLSDCTLKSWPWPRLGVLGIPCLGFQWLSFRERVQCPLLSSWL